MRFLNVLNQDEQVAGLEISSGFLRLCLIGKDKKTNVPTITQLLAQPLPEGVIVGGEIKNHGAFIASLNELKKNLSIKVRYTVVSIPANPIYFRWVQFPRSINATKLTETMNTFLNFQLPKNKEDVYSDWHKTEQTKEWDTFVVSAPKQILNPYIELLGATGFTPIAIEFRPLSIGRAATLPKDQAVLLTSSNKEGTEIFVVKNGALLFSRFVPAQFSGQLSEEIRKVSASLEADGQQITEVLDIKDVKSNPELSFPEGLKDVSEWLAPLGAALRGALPRAEDRFLSLMPASTQKAYSYQKAINFSVFLAHLTIGLTIFFTAAYIGTWLLLLSLQQSTAKSVDILSSQPTQNSNTQAENKIREANKFIAATSSIIKTSPQFSILVENLKEKVTEGITITNLGLSSSDQVVIAGVSRNRPDLNRFKKSLESSEYLTDVALPLTNLQQKENIPFSISFKLKDINVLYPK